MGTIMAAIHAKTCSGFSGKHGFYLHTTLFLVPIYGFVLINHGAIRMPIRQ
jgi:hypothetical protein